MGTATYYVAQLGIEASSTAREVQKLSNYFNISDPQGFRLERAFGDDAAANLQAAFSIREGIQQDAESVIDALERIGVSIDGVRHADLPSVLFAINQAVRDSELPLFELDNTLKELGITQADTFREVNLATSNWAEEHTRQIAVASNAWNAFIGFFGRVPGQMRTAAREIGNIAAFAMGAAMGAGTIPTQVGLTAGGATGVGFGAFDPNFRLRVGDQFYGTATPSSFSEGFRGVANRTFINPSSQASTHTYIEGLGYVPNAIGQTFNQTPLNRPEPIQPTIGGGGGVVDLSDRSLRAFEQLQANVLQQTFTQSLSTLISGDSAAVGAAQAILAF